MKDEEIIPLIQKINKLTFLTRDLGFYKKTFCPPVYGIICLAVNQSKVSIFIRRILKVPTFDPQAKRMGKIIYVDHRGIRFWTFNVDIEEKEAWIK